MERIVQIIGNGRPGGGTTIVLTLSQMLADSGAEVTIITQKHSPLIQEATTARLNVRGIDFSRRGSTIANARSIARHVRELKADIMHAHGGRAGLPSALVARRMGQKFIYTVHGFHFRHKPLVMRQFAWAAEAFCMARADVTVFVSDGDRVLARRHRLSPFLSAQCVIKNAIVVDPSLFNTPKTFDIGFLGRLHYQKNPLILADILKALRPLKPSLCVIGDGDLRTELEGLLRAEGLLDQVTLQGERRREDALVLLASCRVLLLPSRWEGHPLAPIEAMHLGLPVVASDIPGNNEIVVDGGTGYLVPTYDAALYADRLSQLLSNAELMARIRYQAKQRVELEYSLERMVADYARLYARPARAAQAREHLSISRT